MYNISDLNAALYGLVGFRQTLDTTYPELTSDVTTTRSGLYVQDEHPLLTVENVYLTTQDYENIQFSVYAIGTTYTIGERVTFGGFIYSSLVNSNLGFSPEISPTQWANIRAVPTLSEYMKNIMLSAGNKLLRAVFDNKKLKGITKSIFENIALFSGAGRKTDLVTKSGRMVGFELVPHRFENIALTIQKIGLQFDSVQTALNIYVYHSSQIDAIQVIPVTTANPISFYWEVLTATILKYLDNTHDAGGAFYITYYEDDIAGQAINKKTDFTNADNCQYCDPYTYESFVKYKKFVTITPFNVLAADLNGVQLWDISKNNYTYDTNYGLNLVLSVGCELSNFIFRNESLLSNYLSKFIGYEFLKRMEMNTRTSDIAAKVRKDAAIAIYTHDEHNKGYKADLDEMIEALDFDLSDLDSPCLPCNRNKGVRFGSL